ncbi:MAG: 50S ribosomal protein L23 [Candidatus Altiarchaeota archaeon]|nr:50S ribosomal protein L23 [Candidatus Altiarchaeota archaeon]
MDIHKVITYPLMGEKATLLRDGNKLTFIVDKNATKKDIKNAIETLYNVKTTRITTINTVEGLKKAHIKLDKAYNAEEIASQFGVL